MKKQIWDIDREDMAQHPVWFFPMDEDVDDESVVCPVGAAEDLDINTQIVVASRFTANNGRSYEGYIYWGKPKRLCFLQPILFAGDACVTFWNGMGEPSREYTEKVRAALGENAFPIEFESLPVYGLEVIKGTLEGLYYIGPWGDACMRL